jgi:hypothetical protein
MAVINTGLIAPKFGGLFTAASLTKPITVLDDFTLLSGPTGGTWYHWGHLSRESLPEVSQDGGETTTLSTWLQMNTDSDTTEGVETITYSPVQLDAATLASMSALNGKIVSALVLWVSGLKRFGIWYPKASVALTGRPAPNGTDQYAEAKMALTILKPDASLGLADLADPTGGIAPWPSDTDPNSLYFDNSAFLAAAG